MIHCARTVVKPILLALISFSMAAADNPLLSPSKLPYEFPPFDRIRDEHFKPAIERGMREELADIESIAGQPAKPTFENTIVRLERSGELFRRASEAFITYTSS